MHDCDKILIVDDDEDDRILLGESLHKNGIQHVDSVTSGEEAVEYVTRLKHEQQPNLMFVDLGMHAMSGMELLRWVRQNYIFDHVPIVILSNSRNEDDKATAIALKAKAFYVKPGTDQELDEIVRKALEHCRQSSL